MRVVASLRTVPNSGGRLKELPSSYAMAIACADDDSYNPVDHVDIQVQVDGAPFNNHFTVPSDVSVIAVDTPGNQYGVDFWLNDGKGNAVTTNPLTKTPWPPLVTIFGPGRLQQRNVLYM